MARPTDPLDEVERVMALEEERERQLTPEQKSHLKLIGGITFAVVAIALATLLWIVSR